MHLGPPGGDVALCQPPVEPIWDWNVCIWDLWALQDGRQLLERLTRFVRVERFCAMLLGQLVTSMVNQNRTVSVLWWSDTQVLHQMPLPEG